MSIHRDNIPFGPAKIVHGSDTFYSAGDIDISVVTEYADVNSDQFGAGVKTIIDQTVEVSFRPQSLYSLLAKVWPTAHIAPTTIGNRIIGGSAVPLVLHGEDSSLFTVYCSALTGIPSYALGVDKGEFGTMKFNGVVTNGKGIGEAASLYTYAATGGTYGTPSAPDYLGAANWEVTWGSTVLAGTLLEAATLTPELKIEPVKAGHRTLDYRMAGIQFHASVMMNLTMVELAALYADAATFSYGGRNSTLGKDLVFTSALANVVTLPTSMIEKHAAKFGMKEARSRAVDFRTSVLSGARATYA